MMIVMVVVVVMVAWDSSDTLTEIWNSNDKQYLIWEPPDPCRWKAAAL
jgi:hypothetical protein